MAPYINSLKHKRFYANVFILAFILAFTLYGAVAARYANYPGKSPYITGYWVYPSTAVSTNNDYIIVPAMGTDTAAHFDFINGTSDKAASVFTFKTVNSPKITTASSPSGAAVINTPGTGNFAANDIIVVIDPATKTSERLVVSSVATATVTATGNLVNTYPAGSQVYKTTAGVTIAVGATTKEIDNTFYVGQKGKPVVVEMDSTSAGQFSAFGTYIRDAP
jgi:hypothetical protein